MLSLKQFGIRGILSMSLLLSCMTSALAVDLDGTWKGMLFQMPADPKAQSYPAVITVAGLDKVSVDYPSLKCGGQLKLIRSDDATATFREKITRGCDNCVDGGTVLIKKFEDGSASLKWTDPDPQSGIICRGQLIHSAQ